MNDDWRDLLCSVVVNRLLNERPSLVNENGMMDIEILSKAIPEKKTRLIDSSITFFFRS